MPELNIWGSSHWFVQTMLGTSLAAKQYNVSLPGNVC